jgi:hypothetical protein
MKLPEYVQDNSVNDFISLSKLLDMKKEDMFNNFLITFKEQIKQYKVNKLAKQSSQMQVDDEMSLSIVHSIKAYILFRKFIKGKIIYSYIDKNTYDPETLAFITKNLHFALKENIICTGCDSFLDKAQVNILLNYNSYYICQTCNEISCM